MHQFQDYASAHLGIPCFYKLEPVRKLIYDSTPISSVFDNHHSTFSSPMATVKCCVFCLQIFLFMIFDISRTRLLISQTNINSSVFSGEGPFHSFPLFISFTFLSSFPVASFISNWLQFPCCEGGFRLLVSMWCSPNVHLASSAPFCASAGVGLAIVSAHCTKTEGLGVRMSNRGDALPSA